MMQILRFLPLAGWPLAALFGLMYMSARDAVQDERTACNEASIQSALDAERLTHEATRRNYQSLIDELASTVEIERESREIAMLAEKAAKADLVARETTINQLMIEASIDDIPDSSECLNVFVPGHIVDRLLHTANCPGISGGTRSSPNSTCSRAARFNPTDSASGDFSTITYGDSLKLWGMDRDIIETLNGQLLAIDNLGINNGSQ
jgi:hypothetical protein